MPHTPILRGALLALCCAILAACGGVPAEARAPGQQAATAPPPPTAATAPPPPTATPAPPPTATPAPPPTATPAPPPPDRDVPPRVGLQVGHWRIEEHPQEQVRLRKFSGAYYGGYDEWELNILIAEEARRLLEARGVVVDMLPATVPVGYTADAFVSIHVDGVTGPQAATRRGWKVATPFRASAASDALAAALAASYPAATGLPADPQGPSYDMRAYYAFAFYRYWHSVAPTTPAAIVETGFMTHPADRELLFGRTELVGRGVAEGVLAYLDATDYRDPAVREPAGRPMQRPAGPGVPLRDRASAQSPVQRELQPGEDLVPMAEAGEWVLVFAQGGSWDLGWVRADELAASGAPMQPPFPCCGE